MKELKFICVQPDDDYYTWQVHLWLESLRNIGHSDKAIVLIFIPYFRNKNEKWQQIIDLYPETEFVFYKDEEDAITKALGIYIPVLRPYCLTRYFQEHPEMVGKAIFYCDSDTQFTEKFDVSEFIDDNICYLSDTNSYINASYFDSKVRDVIPDKLKLYNERDILNETASFVGISREICEQNNDNSGGAQYLLKNIDAAFWQKVTLDCLHIRMHLSSVNKEFFATEDKGFQGWCADMWAVLWNLWLRGQETKVIPELDFAWATDSISKLERCTIFHNAGVVNEMMGSVPSFYKGKYHKGGDPFKDPHLEKVYNNDESKKHCTHYYVTKMMELKNKYNLNY
jgi:hypothetical protein